MAQASLMAHLIGPVAGEDAALRRSVICALAALTCASLHAQAEFLSFGGVNAILQSLLLVERGSHECLAAVRLVADGAAHTDQCRSAIREAGGIEVLTDRKSVV